MRAIRFVAALSAAVVAMGGSALAETSESKRELIRELLRISGGGASAEQVARLFLAEIQVVYGSMVDEVMASEGDLSAEQRGALRAHLADFDRFALAFSERFPQRIDLDRILEEAYLPLYDQHFDEDELRVIVGFYRTPAGRKTVAVMPALMQEGLRATVPVVEPKVMALVGEILAERRSEVLP
jgi:hypothetical protein